MSGALNGEALETWCIVTDIRNDVGTVKMVLVDVFGADQPAIKLHPGEQLWRRFDAPPVGSQVVRRRRSEP